MQPFGCSVALPFGDPKYQTQQLRSTIRGKNPAAPLPGEHNPPPMLTSGKQQPSQRV
jgi:hypothetical protein